MPVIQRIYVFDFGNMRALLNEEVRAILYHISGARSRYDGQGCSGLRKDFVMAKVNVCYLRDSASVYGSGISYATSCSAGMDLRACFGEEKIVIQPGQRVQIPSGICVEPMVPDVAGFIYSRSGLGAVKGLTVAQGVGVVDADYRGELIIWLLNTSDSPLTVQRGERVAQLIFQPVCHLEPCAVDALSETVRGSGGFGHTGRV